MAQIGEKNHVTMQKMPTSIWENVCLLGYKLHITT